MNQTYNLAGGDVCLFHADCRDALRALPDNCIDSVCTDPPYALVSVTKRFGSPTSAPAQYGKDGAFARQSAGFMGKVWDTGEVAFDPAFWAEVLRVLKPGGHVAAMGGTRTYHHLAMAIELAGFEVRDSLSWIYATGFPKSQNVSAFIDRELGLESAVGEVTGRSGSERNCMAGDFTGGEYRSTVPISSTAIEFDGFGTALKPAHEPIVLARKPLSEATVAANVLRWRTGALNIGACRVPSDSPVLSHGGVSKDRSVYREGDFGKTYEGGGREYQTEGRWPANVVHDGSAEVVEAFPITKAATSRTKRSDRKFAPGTEGQQGTTELELDAVYNDGGGSAARFFFNSAESDEQWLSRIKHVSGADESSHLSSEFAVFALTHVVVQSMPQWEPRCIASPVHFTNVTPKELRRISEAVIEMIQTFDGRCSPESLPRKRSQSDNLADIVATQKQIDIITITINRSKSNGCVEPATFSITRRNSEHGVKDYASRLHYSAKASKGDRVGSKHPTIKPVSLMSWLSKLITPPGGIVLDPFAGSGTTGQAALQNGFKAILCEREAEYVADIIRRLAEAPSLVPSQSGG